MDINQMFGTLQQLAPQIASSYCVVNGAFMGLNEIENMGYEECDYSVEKQYRFYAGTQLV